MIYERVFGKKVCSRVDLIDDHIRKHSLGISREAYIGLADRLTSGIIGVHIVEDNGEAYTIVVNGSVEIEGNRYSIVRSTMRGRRKRPIHRRTLVPRPYQTEDECEEVEGPSDTINGLPIIEDELSKYIASSS